MQIGKQREGARRCQRRETTDWENGSREFKLPNAESPSHRMGAYLTTQVAAASLPPPRLWFDGPLFTDLIGAGLMAAVSRPVLQQRLSSLNFTHSTQASSACLVRHTSLFALALLLAVLNRACIMYVTRKSNYQTTRRTRRIAREATSSANTR